MFFFSAGTLYTELPSSTNDWASILNDISESSHSSCQPDNYFTEQYYDVADRPLPETTESRFTPGTYDVTPSLDVNMDSCFMDSVSRLSEMCDKRPALLEGYMRDVKPMDDFEYSDFDIPGLYDSRF